MKKRSIKQLVFSLLFLVILVGCTKEVFIDFEELPPQLSVFLFLSNDLVNYPNATVHTSSTSLDQEPLIPYENASVLLYENGILLNQYLHHENGNYYPDSFPTFTPGSNYELEVVTEDFGTLRSEAIMPEFPEIVEAIHTPKNLTDIHLHPYDEVKLSFEKQEGPRRFYQASVYAQKKWNPQEVYQMWTWGNVPQIISAPLGRGIIFSDEHWEPGIVDLDLRFSIVYFHEDDDNVLIELSEITEELYFYLQGLNNQINAANNPFAEPVIIPSNIEGGLGLFSLQAASHFVIPQ